VPHLNRFATLCVLISCSVACKSKPAPTEAPVSSAAPSATALPSASAAAAVASTGLPEADVKAFVEKWQAAQNARDFDGYSQLYATRFMGVKRVGTYSKRFDRASWLADRKPMFEAGAQVKVTDVELVAVAGSTRAVFTQEFTSGTFRDVGKKELFLVAAPGGIAISKEEMLDSKVSEQADMAETVLAYHRDGAVVERGFDKRKLKGAPKLLKTDANGPIEIAFSVTPEELSAGSRAWLGREVTAYAANGKSCSGKVTRFEVRVQAVPHFGMRQAWNGELDEPKATPAQIAENIERMAQSQEHFVVGVLDQACSGSWASAAPALPFIAAKPVEGALRGTAIAAFKALPAYVELQKRFLKENKGANGGWEEASKLLRVMELRAPNRPALLLVTARTDGGCDDFSGSLSAFWQVDGEKLTLLAPSFSDYVTLRGAIDQGASGLALLSGPDDFDDQLAVLRVAPRVSRRVLLATAVWDCLC
jgi:ketosteroid isomerase-like protein